MFKTIFTTILLISLSVYSADRALEKLILKQKYQQASSYLEKKYPAEQRDEELWVKAGLICEKSGMKEKALSCYLSAYKLNNNDYSALMALGQLYNELNFSSNAYVMLQKLISNGENDPDVFWELAQTCLKLGKLDEAKQYLSKIPYKPEAQKTLGLILFEQKNYPEAIPILAKSFYQKRDTSIAWKLSEYYINNKKISECVECLEYVVANYKEAYSIHLALARYYMESSEYSRAIELYVLIPEQKYVAIDYYNIALYKKSEGRVDDALQFFSRAVDLSPKDSDIWKNSNVNLGQIYLGMKDYKSALQYLKIAGDKIQDSDLQLARCYDAMKDYKNSGLYATEYIKQNPSNVSAHMILIVSLEKQGYITKAKELRTKLISIDPKNATTQFEMGEYHYMNSQYSQAIRFFEKSYLLDQNGICLERIADCAFRLDQADKVRDACETILKTNPDHVLALDLLYKVYLTDKRYADAERCLEKLLQIDPSKLEYCLQLSYCYETLQKQDKIPGLDEKIIELSPTNDKSKRRLAEYRFKKGKYEDALNLYNDLIRMGKVVSMDYPNIIQIALSLNLKTKAIEYLTQYIGLRPHDADLYKKMADLYYDQKNYDQAFTNYRIALRKNPELTGLYCNYSKLLLMNKWEVQYVVKILEKAVSLKEADFENYVSLGNAYYSFGNYEQALVSYDQATKLNSKDMVSFSKVADCQVRTGRDNEAIVSYEQLTILDTKNKANFKTLGNLYFKKNKKKEAVQSYKKYLENFVDDELATIVAMFEYDQQNPKEALKYFAKMESSSQQTLFPQAECHIVAKQYKEAVVDFKKFIEKYPQSSHYYVANMHLAVAYDSTKDIINAINHYQIYLQKELNADIAYRVGLLQEEGKNVEQAKQTYVDNTYKYPTDYRNFLKLGTLTEKTPKKSLIYFQKAVTLNDTILWVWLKMGSLYDSLGDEDGKITAYKKAVSLAPQNFEANKYLGITLFNKGKAEDGLLYLELARSHNAADPEIMYVLGKSYVMKGNMVEATLLFKTAKKLQPNNQSIRFTLVKHLFGQKQYEESLREAQELLVLKDSKEYFDTYLSILFSLKRYSTIEDVIKQRRKQNPESIDLLMILARAQTENSEYDKAIETYKMITYIKEYAPGYLGRARVYMRQQKVNEAKTYYEKALKLDPNSAEAELGLARIYKFSAKKDLFLEHLKKAQQLDPKNPEIQIEMNNIQTLQ
jgi:tetratricopeptide (TPR) repeat protein